ncbi:hypothetical protein ABIC09_003701 [Bradyrhizobium sp. S3.12.5]
MEPAKADRAARLNYAVRMMCRQSKTSKTTPCTVAGRCGINDLLAVHRKYHSVWQRCVGIIGAGHDQRRKAEALFRYGRPPAPAGNAGDRGSRSSVTTAIVLRNEPPKRVGRELIQRELALNLTRRAKHRHDAIIPQTTSHHPCYIRLACRLPPAWDRSARRHVLDPAVVAAEARAAGEEVREVVAD